MLAVIVLKGTSNPTSVRFQNCSFPRQERVRRRQRDKLAALLLEKVGVTGDLKASDFASITREDGKKQGMPLYYFARDAAPGDTKGDGVKEIWSLAKP